MRNSEYHFVDNLILNRIINFLHSHPYWSLILCGIGYILILNIKEALFNNNQSQDHDEEIVEDSDNNSTRGIFSWAWTIIKGCLASAKCGPFELKAKRYFLTFP